MIIKRKKEKKRGYVFLWRINLRGACAGGESDKCIWVETKHENPKVNILLALDINHFPHLLLTPSHPYAKPFPPSPFIN